MVNEIHLANFKEKKIITSDIAGHNPIYIFNDKRTIYYSINLVELLDEISGKLNISNLGLSFLLKNGVIPTPRTIYKNLYVVSIGNEISIEAINNSFSISFSNNFPFIRRKDLNNVPNEIDIINLLADATISRVKNNKNNFLFHSAGKDSNMIALALSDNGFNDLCCVSHQSVGKKDESNISKKIAAKLGFKHSILTEPGTLHREHILAFENYFRNIPLPSVDEVTLAYPIYNTQIDFKESNIIDGMGNDVYIGHIPSLREYRFAKYLSNLSFLKNPANNFRSENYLNIISLNRVEWIGLVGFMNKDCSLFFNDFKAVDEYWNNLDRDNSNLDYIDLRSKVRGGIIDQEIFMRKVRNFADINFSNVIFPWADSNLANYFYSLNEKYLFDRKNLRNKVILREILKKRIGLNSDEIGKLGFSFNYWKILDLMFDNVRSNILDCSLWNKSNMESVLNRLYNRASISNRFSNRAKALIQRLYLISMWHNNNKYINYYAS